MQDDPIEDRPRSSEQAATSGIGAEVGQRGRARSLTTRWKGHEADDVYVGNWVISGLIADIAPSRILTQLRHWLCTAAMILMLVSAPIWSASLELDRITQRF
jgi:hypothetical protein